MPLLFVLIDEESSVKRVFTNKEDACSELSSRDNKALSDAFDELGFDEDVSEKDIVDASFFAAGNETIYDIVKIELNQNQSDGSLAVYSDKFGDVEIDVSDVLSKLSELEDDF